MNIGRNTICALNEMHGDMHNFWIGYHKLTINCFALAKEWKTNQKIKKKTALNNIVNRLSMRRFSKNQRNLQIGEYFSVVDWHKHKSYSIWHETKAEYYVFMHMIAQMTVIIIVVIVDDGDGGECCMHTTRISIEISHFIYETSPCPCSVFSVHVLLCTYCLYTFLFSSFIWLICIAGISL